MKIGLLFPGQGAQYVGMGKDFYDNYPKAKELFDLADELLGRKISDLIFYGPDELLVETRNSQLAIFITSAAIFSVIQENFALPITAVAGLSLGEYTALYASGRLSFKETLQLIEKRAQFMNEACEREKGKMAAIVGLSSADIEKTVEQTEGVWVANYNTPAQTVISAREEKIDMAVNLLKEAGAKRALVLHVHGAFHSPLMAAAKEALSPYIDLANFSVSSIKIAMNQSGKFTADEQIKAALKEQVTSSVRWYESIEEMRKEGVDLYLEVGPGKTLTQMNRKIGVQGLFCVEKVEELGKLEEHLATSVLK